MTLSERLEQARRKRLVDAGLLSADQLEPPRPVEAPKRSLFDPVVIEALPPSGPHVVVNPTEAAPPLDSDEPAPPCPNCGTPAHVDMVDLVSHRSHYSCPNCHAMWQVVDVTRHS